VAMKNIYSERVADGELLTNMELGTLVMSRSM